MTPSKGRLERYLVLFSILSCSLILASDARIAAHLNIRPGLTDQLAYLNLARGIESGETLSSGNQHPLYPALIAVTHDPLLDPPRRLIAGAKTLSVLTGVFAIAVVSFVAWSEAGPTAALLVALFISSSSPLATTSGLVSPEPLLIALTTLGLHGIRKGGRWTMPSGMLAGLAYLTKGSGIVLAAALGLSRFIRPGKRRLLLGAAALFVFSLTASPLLLWNIFNHGTPIYNVNSHDIFWFESVNEQQFPEEEQVHSLPEYVERHGLPHLAFREIEGLYAVLSMTASLLLPSDLAPLGWLILAAAAAGWWREKDPRSKWGLGIWYIIYSLLLSWFSRIALYDRFLFPALPYIWILSAREVLRLMHRVLKDRTERVLRWMIIGLSVVLGLSAAASVAAIIKLPPLESRPLMPPDAAVTWRYLEAGLDSSDTLAFDPWPDLPIYSFLGFNPAFSTMEIPYASRMEDLTEIFDRSEARYLLVHRTVLHTLAAGAVRPYFTETPERRLIPTRPLPGWELVWSSPNGDFYLFHRQVPR